MERTVRRCIDLGVTYFDTAETYNEGRSEESLGLALESVPREEVLIGTKVSPSNTEPDTLVAHCEASLRRLKTDYVDIYMIHWPIHPSSIRHFTDDEEVVANPPSEEEAFEAMYRLQKAGKIRYVGVSNYGVERLERARGYGVDISANELPYSLLTRAIECDILPYCRKSGVGVIGYMTLLQGVMAGIYPTLRDVPPHRRRTRHFGSEGSALARHGDQGAEAETNRALERIRLICAELGMTMPDIAIKWVLASESITSALVGTTRLTHLESNVRAAEEPLPSEIFQRLNAVTQPLWEKLGPSFDYYESPENDRT